MRNQNKFIACGVIAFGLSSALSRAEYFTAADPGNPGTADGSYYVPVDPPSPTASSFSEGWQQLTKTAYSLTTYNFPGFGFWPDLVSQTGPNTGLNKIHKVSNGPGGGPFPASASIYYGGTSAVVNTAGGELAIQNSVGGVLSGVKTIVFQIDIGEAWLYDFHNGDAPELTYYTSTSGPHTVSAAFASHYKEVYNGQVLMDGVMEDLNINSYAYQFNVSGAVTSFSINFEGVQHAQFYGAGLQQFNETTAVSLLPEPLTP